jgi:hypothetical protein
MVSSHRVRRPFAPNRGAPPPGDEALHWENRPMWHGAGLLGWRGERLSPGRQRSEEIPGGVLLAEGAVRTRASLELRRWQPGEQSRREGEPVEIRVRRWRSARWSGRWGSCACGGNRHRRSFFRPAARVFARVDYSARSDTATSAAPEIHAAYVSQSGRATVYPCAILAYVSCPSTTRDRKKPTGPEIGQNLRITGRTPFAGFMKPLRSELISFGDATLRPA